MPRDISKKAVVSDGKRRVDGRGGGRRVCVCLCWRGEEGGRRAAGRERARGGRAADGGGGALVLGGNESRAVCVLLQKQSKWLVPVFFLALRGLKRKR